MLSLSELQVSPLGVLFVLLGIESRALHLSGMYSTTDTSMAHRNAKPSVATASSYSSRGRCSSRYCSYLPQCTARFCPMDLRRLAGPCSQWHFCAHAAADLSSSSSQVCRVEMAADRQEDKVETAAPGTVRAQAVPLTCEKPQQVHN